MIEKPEPYHQAISNFRFTGLEVMSERLAEFSGGVSGEKKVLHL
jgi:hypothetical protein